MRSLLLETNIRVPYENQIYDPQRNPVTHQVVGWVHTQWVLQFLQFQQEVSIRFSSLRSQELIMPCKLHNHPEMECTGAFGTEVLHLHKGRGRICKEVLIPCLLLDQESVMSLISVEEQSILSADFFFLAPDTGQFSSNHANCIMTWFFYNWPLLHYSYIKIKQVSPFWNFLTNPRRKVTFKKILFSFIFQFHSILWL